MNRPQQLFRGVESVTIRTTIDGLADEDFAEVGTECVGGLGDCVTPEKWVCNEAGTGVLCSADVTAGGFEICNVSMTIVMEQLMRLFQFQCPLFRGCRCLRTTG